MRVLMVEDAMDLAETVVARLARAGIVCDLAATVEAAEDFRAVQGYDALVLDINLPDGSGLTLLRRIRAEGDRTPVLMLTALVSVDDRVSALDLGADDYLGKPFDQRELEARLRALVRRDAEQDQEAGPDLPGDLRALGALDGDLRARDALEDRLQPLTASKARSRSAWRSARSSTPTERRISPSVTL